MQKYAQKVKKGHSFIVFKKSKPLFKISPIEESSWREVIDFTKEESFSSAKYVSELREEIGGRYRKEIGDALDELFKKPKKEWPKLLK